MLTYPRWSDRSFFIEIKPRVEFASVFVDCPPVETSAECLVVGENDNDAICSATLPIASDSHPDKKLEAIVFKENSIQLRKVTDTNKIMEEDECLESVSSYRDCKNSSVLIPYSGYLKNIRFHPDTVCAATWADNHRIFMCKIQAHCVPDPFRAQTTVYRMMRETSSSLSVQECVENRLKPTHLACSNCSAVLFESSNSLVRCCVSDNWMDVSQNFEYFCDCSVSCGGHANHINFLCEDKTKNHWYPTNEQLTVSDSFVFALTKSLKTDVVVVNEQGVANCANCNSELGTELRKMNGIVGFHHSVVALSSAEASYVESRFCGLERFFTYILLSHCDAKSSTKIVYQSYDKKPRLLVWVLDSYAVITTGALKEKNIAVYGGTEMNQSYPALKVLYKLFDDENVQTDPRANGEDLSVSIVKMPLGCCMKLAEILLTSSHALPPVCRSVGQFYIGILKMKESMDCN